jgi:hypothetical protein
LPALSDNEAAHLIDVLYDLAHIVQAYYALHHSDTLTEDACAPEPPPATVPATIDLFDNEHSR